jgi:hypothetical protein
LAEVSPATEAFSLKSHCCQLAAALQPARRVLMVGLSVLRANRQYPEKKVRKPNHFLKASSVVIGKHRHRF